MPDGQNAGGDTASGGKKIADRRGSARSCGSETNDKAVRRGGHTSFRREQAHSRAQRKDHLQERGATHDVRSKPVCRETAARRDDGPPRGPPRAPSTRWGRRRERLRIRPNRRRHGRHSPASTGCPPGERAALRSRGRRRSQAPATAALPKASSALRGSATQLRECAAEACSQVLARAQRLGADARKHFRVPCTVLGERRSARALPRRVLQDATRAPALRQETPPSHLGIHDSFASLRREHFAHIPSPQREMQGFLPTFPIPSVKYNSPAHELEHRVRNPRAFLPATMYEHREGRSFLPVHDK